MKIKATGNVVIITTNIPYEALRDYFPAGVTIYDDKNAPLYKVSAADPCKKASISNCGAIFTAMTEDGKAMIGLQSCHEKVDIPAFVKANADAITALKNYENMVTNQITERKELLAAVEESVEVE